MGRKSRAKRERRNQPIDLLKTATQSMAVLMLDEGYSLEELLADPVLSSRLTPQNILGIAQTWQRKTPQEQAEMTDMASRFVNLTIETVEGRK